MSEFRAQYRLQIFQPDGTTLLTPRAGSAHTDPFKVTTELGVSGWKPYLRAPSGRPGRFDRLSCSSSFGDITAELVDAEVTSNLIRWVTAFAGDADYRQALRGLPFLIQENVDYGDGTGYRGYADYAGGKVSSITAPEPSESGPIIRLNLRDHRIETFRNIFVGPPHSAVASYARPCMLWPIGLQEWTPGTGKGWLNFPSTPPAQGKMVNLSLGLAVEVYERQNQWPALRKERRLRPCMGLRKGLNSHAMSSTTGMGMAPDLRAVVKRLDTGTTAEYALAYRGGHGFALQDGSNVGPILLDAGGDIRGEVKWIGLEALPGGTAVPPLGTDVEIFLYNAFGPRDDAPLLINAVHPGLLARDLLNSYFSDLDDAGAPKCEAVPYDASSFSALIADTSIRPVSFAIARRANLLQWVEESLFRTSHLSMRTKGNGKLYLVNLRLPPSLGGLPVIGDTHYERVEGELGKDLYTQINIEYPHVTIDDLGLAELRDKSAKDVADIHPTGLRIETEGPLSFFTDSFSDLPVRELRIATPGIPATHGYLQNTPTDLAPYDEVAREYDALFGGGAQYLDGDFLRSLVTDSAWPGDWVKVNVKPQINPFTNERGGERVMMLLDSTRAEQRNLLRMRFLDRGPDQNAAVPAIGTLAAGTNPKHQVSVPIILNAASDAVSVDYAVTAQTVGTRPADTDAAWKTARWVDTTATIAIGSLPSRRRIWVRARSVPSNRLASAFVYASGSIDTQAITAPTSPAATVTGRSIALTCTPGDASYPLMPMIATSPATPVAALPLPLAKGSNRYVFEELAAGSYNVGFCHVDEFGGDSTIAQVSSVATGTATVLEAPRRVYFRQASATALLQKVAVSADQVTTGFEIRWSTSELHGDVRIQLATDAGFSTIVVDRTLPADLGATLLNTPLDGVRRYARILCTRAGFTDSAWSSTVTGYPTILRSGDGPDLFAGIYAQLKTDPDGTLRRVIGTEDPDTDGAYFQVTIGTSSAGPYPVVDETDTFVTRSAMPSDAVVLDGSGLPVKLLPGQVALLTARGWSQVAGLSPEVYDASGSGLGPAIALDNFRIISRTEALITYGWEYDNGTTWVYDQLLPEPIPDDPWPDITALPTAILSSGTNMYAVLVPRPGYVRYVQFDPHGQDLAISGSSRRVIVSPTLEPPDRIVAATVTVDDDTGTADAQVYAADRTSSYRYAYTTGVDPAWPTDAAVEAGTVRAITGADSFTLPAVTLAYGEMVRIRFAPYTGADGKGTTGTGDHGEIRNAQEVRLKAPMELDQTTVTEAGAVGTFGVTVDDKGGLATGLYAKTKSGADTETGWSLVSATPTDGVEYQRTVVLKEKHQSKITFRLDGMLHGAAFSIFAVSPGMDLGKVPDIVIVPRANENNDTATATVVGDSDTLSIKILGAVSGMPTDAAVRAATAINGRVLTPTDIGNLVTSLVTGQTVYFKAFGYSAASGGGIESTAAATAQFVYKVLRPLLEITTESESGSTGTLGVTPRDPNAQADELRYISKTGEADWTNYSAGLASSAPANGTEYQTTVPLIEGHNSFIRFRLAFTLAGVTQYIYASSGGFDLGFVPRLTSVALFVGVSGNLIVAASADSDARSDGVNPSIIWNLGTSSVPSDPTLGTHDDELLTSTGVKDTGVAPDLVPTAIAVLKIRAVDPNGAVGPVATYSLRTA